MKETTIRRRNIDGARYYEVRPGVYLRSVTTILGVINKPKGKMANPKPE